MTRVVGRTRRGQRVREYVPDGRWGNAATTLSDIARIASRVSEVLRDLQELPGYHPAHHQVLARAIRP